MLLLGSKELMSCWILVCASSALSAPRDDRWKLPADFCIRYGVQVDGMVFCTKVPDQHSMGAFTGVLTKFLAALGSRGDK